VSRVLVIGRHGQLAASLAERAPRRGIALDFAGRPELDLADPEAIRRTVAASGASILVNAAAYTAVDDAEDAPEQAFAINAAAPRALAEAARETGARLIHVSTDYVFDGRGEAAWSEDDSPAPATAYGRSKLAGEEGVREALPDHVIVRTAWVYSPFGRNFVKTMLTAARTRPELRVVADQVGNPTSALDLADGLLAAIAAWGSDPKRGLGATYHLAGTGAASWADFAAEILAVSRDLGGPSVPVVPVASSEWPAKAPRPLNSRLDSGRFAETFGYRAPPWQESLRRVVERLLASAA
jgi:dTDP-4-dehydrorhamnose reductase